MIKFTFLIIGKKKSKSSSTSVSHDHLYGTVESEPVVNSRVLFNKWLLRGNIYHYLFFFK
jgi:hypothetical protein